MTDGRFTVEQRMRRRREFERAYSEGTRVRARFMTLFVLSSGRTESRLGVAASRKIGSAVDRNRAKRLVREVFRSHCGSSLDQHPKVDVVVVPRRELLDAPFASLAADYASALERHERTRAPHERTRQARPGSSSRI